MTYKESLSSLRTHTRGSASFESDPGIYPRKMRELLDAVGNPEHSLKFIHVAGTAGKGTVSAHIHAAIVSGGEKAGLFTSPYITTPIDQIQAGSLYISPESFASIFESIRPHLERGGYSSFQAMLAISLLYFKSQNCRWAVIETGIGGRFDPSNAIPCPQAAVITNVDYDHTDLLGKTLPEIARDKAGIIKRGENGEISRFFTSENNPAIQDIFKQACADTGATFCATDRDSLAATVVRTLGFSGDIPAIHLPCRFEIMERPPAHPYVILDAAHDRIKMRDAAAKLATLEYNKLTVVIGLSGAGPDRIMMLPEIIPLADRIIVTSTANELRCLADTDEVVPFIRPHMKPGATIEEIPDPQTALDIAIAEADQDDCVIVTGSFFLAGELRKRWFSEEFILHERRSDAAQIAHRDIISVRP